jgi:hypothetical protein
VADQVSRTDLFAILGFSIGMPIVLFLEFRWMSRVSQARLREWAARNGYRLLKSRLRWFFRGPFCCSWTSAVVFRVVFEDRGGNRRSGWYGYFLYSFIDPALAKEYIPALAERYMEDGERWGDDPGPAAASQG